MRSRKVFKEENIELNLECFSCNVYVFFNNLMLGCFNKVFCFCYFRFFLCYFISKRSKYIFLKKRIFRSLNRKEF